MGVASCGARATRNSARSRCRGRPARLPRAANASSDGGCGDVADVGGPRSLARGLKCSTPMTKANDSGATVSLWMSPEVPDFPALGSDEFEPDVCEIGADECAPRCGARRAVLFAEQALRTRGREARRR